MAEITPVARGSGHITRHVIFIHGLCGHIRDAWTKSALLERLAQDVRGVSTWSAGYDASESRCGLHLGDASHRSGEHNPATVACRAAVEVGEIILVGHSLGSSVIKQMISDRRQPRPPWAGSSSSGQPGPPRGISWDPTRRRCDVGGPVQAVSQTVGSHRRSQT